MPDIAWSQLVPDDVLLLPPRKWFKVAGIYTCAAPAGADFIRIAMVAVGGQGEDNGGNGAYSRRLAPCTPGEVFQLQVGRPGSGSPSGDSWFRRVLTGEMLCYAERGRGSGGVQGSAANGIGDIRRSGVPNVSSGSDLADMTGFGLAGRFSVDPLRAAGPGGGGHGSYGGSPRHCAGQGCIVAEFYSGDPGITA